MPDVAKPRAAVVGTGFIGGMPDEPQFPTFADGHRENVIAEAVAQSARERRWIEVSS